MMAPLAAAVAWGGAAPVMVREPGFVEQHAGTLPFRFIVYAWDGNEEKLKRLTSRMAEGAELLAVAPAADLASLVRLLGEARCNHFCTPDPEGLQTLGITLRKLLSGDLFGIERYLPARSEVHLTRLRGYRGRAMAVEEVLAFAARAGLRRSVRAAIGQVCEELLMNALYDAPVDGRGQPLFAAVDHRARLDRLSPRPVSIRYAAKPRGFAVSVRDRFGRLDKRTVVRYLEKCLHGPEQIDRKAHGAGLGIYLVANAASQLVVNVAPGIASEVVCTFDVSRSRAGLRALSFFVHPGTAGLT